MNRCSLPNLFGPIVIAAACGLIASETLAAKEFDTPVETTHRQISWDDFKSGDTTGGRWDRGTWAHVSVEIRVDSFRPETRDGGDGKIVAVVPAEIEAYAVMDKFLSGVARGAKNDEVLAHEQLHFDATEAYARQLTVRLFGLEGRGSDAAAAERDLVVQVQQAHAEASTAMFEFQREYDSETGHSRNRKKQKRWGRKIRELLATATSELEAARAARPTP